jgi:hypothetical protein
MTRLCIWTVAVLVAGATTAGAFPTPEQSCQSGRANAAGRYARCIEYELKRTYLENFDAARFGRCVTKYGATWTKLQAEALASPATETCDAARYVDNNDGTVTDNLTALQWEKKTSDATVHDKGNPYSAADGTVFTVFLATLNAAGFAGQHDWRLPTLAELLSIAQPAYPNCSVGPCIDPTFGSTQSDFYWSSSRHQFNPLLEWGVSFFDSGPVPEVKTNLHYARAVRGGF